MVDYYYSLYSPPCQAALLLAKDIGLNLNKKEISTAKGEHLTTEFVKMNPQHTIPTLNDKGFAIWESRVILSYLVEMHSKNDSLYPKDPKKRAIVDQRLYFDLGTLYPKFYNMIIPMFVTGSDVDPAHLAACEEPMKYLDMFLEGHDWVCGDNITIADYSLAVTVSIIAAFGYDLTKHPNTSKWLSRAKNKMSAYKEVVTEGHALMKNMLAEAKKRIQASK